MAENCQASMKMVDSRLRIVGILQATAYRPLASVPKNQVTIYRSDTLVIHQKIVAGIRGML